MVHTTTSLLTRERITAIGESHGVAASKCAGSRSNTNVWSSVFSIDHFMFAICVGTESSRQVRVHCFASSTRERIGTGVVGLVHLGWPKHVSYPL